MDFSPSQIDASFQAAAPPESGAGFGIRLLARLIDIILSLGVGVVGGVLGGVTLAILEAAGAVSPGWENRLQGNSAATFALSLLGGFLYQSVTEGIHGASFGKLLCGLRVLSLDGRPCRFGPALLRNLAYYLDALFFGLIGYLSMKESALNQRYGDRWARTVVVRWHDVPQASRRPGWKFAVGFLMGISCWIFLLAIGLVLRAH